jgi:hypothetical protein
MTPKQPAKDHRKEEKVSSRVYIQTVHAYFPFVPDESTKKRQFTLQFGAEFPSLLKGVVKELGLYQKGELDEILVDFTRFHPRSADDPQIYIFVQFPELPYLTNEERKDVRAGLKKAVVAWALAHGPYKPWIDVVPFWSDMSAIQV